MASTGTLLLLPRFGIPIEPSGQLTVYTAGTTTKATTYSDVNLTTPNLNPLIADANGLFGPIYVPTGTYKIDYADASGVVVFTQDNIASVQVSSTTSNIIDIADGRLTLVSGTPVPSADVTTARTLYYTPYIGNGIVLYDGSSWGLYSFTELSLSFLGASSSSVYDLFAYVSSGTVTLERQIWSTSTTRLTNLTRQDGVLVKSGDATRRYLGTIRTSSDVNGAIDDTRTTRTVWNYYNRVQRSIEVADATASWTYTTATWRQARATATNQAAVVNGWIEETLQLQLMVTAGNTNTGVEMAVGIGADSTTAPSVEAMVADGMTAAAAGKQTLHSAYAFLIGIGYHFFPWLEISDATGTTTWYGTSGRIRSGLFGVWRG